MKLGLVSDGLAHLDRDAFLDQAVELGVTHVEFCTGGWSTAPHLALDALLELPAERERLLDEVGSRGLTISALNASGNPLHPGSVGEADRRTVSGTLRLARHLGVQRVVLMSGLPAGPGDAHPNWITSSWPLEALDILAWQWTERLVPYWCDLAQQAHELSLRLCIEQHGRQCVYNTQTFLRLRAAVAEGAGQAAAAAMGVNFDPSHLLWMGGDPIAAIRALGPCIWHVHAKDTRIEAKASRDGLLDANPTEAVSERAWNYVGVGRGHPVGFWTELLRALAEVGYDDVLSIENEDHALPAGSAIGGAVAVLREAMDAMAKGAGAGGDPSGQVA